MVSEWSLVSVAQMPNDGGLDGLKKRATIIDGYGRIEQHARVRVDWTRWL